MQSQLHNPHRPVLLIAGQVAGATGFARVVRTLAAQLTPWYQVHVFGLDAHGGWPESDGWLLHPNSDLFDLYGIAGFERCLQSLQPNLVLLVNDFWILPKYLRSLRGSSARKLVYFPIDGEVLDPAMLSPLRDFDEIVVYTEFAASVVRRAAGIAALPVSVPLHRPQIIPHGIDTSRFKPCAADPLEQRHIARSQLFPDYPELVDSLIVLNANRNQPRKRIDLTLEGFARFAATTQADARLYLHMGQQEIGWNIARLAKQLGIASSLLFSVDSDGHPDWDDSRLNWLYNACDLGLNTSTGEGWGLVSCEHGATRAAQLVPEHSACQEIWRQAAWLMPAPEPVKMGGFLQGYKVGAEGVASGLARLAERAEMRSDLADAAWQRMNQPALSWPEIASQWHRLFQQRFEAVQAEPNLEMLLS